MCLVIKVSSAVATVVSKHGHIHILINNAGIGSTGTLNEMPLDAILAWEINTLGQLRMVQHAVPHMAMRRSCVTPCLFFFRKIN